MMIIEAIFLSLIIVNQNVPFQCDNIVLMVFIKKDIYEDQKYKAIQIENNLKGINFKFTESPNIKNIRLPLSDILIQNIDVLRNNKSKILSFIDNELSDNNILLCCYDGITISPFIISLYLIEYGDIDKQRVKSIIRSKCTLISMDYDLSLLDL